MESLKTLELFAGIGGFSVGLERTGAFKTIGFCEIDEQCHKVLRKNWPDVPIYTDVTKLSVKNLPEIPDVITGGFPCQDISIAGKGEGLDGKRSGLWWEFHRLIRECNPRWVIIENVAMLRRRGLGQVLRSLAEIGYDAEWHCISAGAVGAPHQRDRLWILAYPNSQRQLQSERSKQDIRRWVSNSSMELADSYSQRLQGHGQKLGRPSQICTQETLALFRSSSGKAQWETEPKVGRLVDGIPRRSHRLRQLGNAVVPQIPEYLGQCIRDQQKGN
jgi:DNA (cytosine-5)-methyltransferase 1